MGMSWGHFDGIFVALSLLWLVFYDLCCLYKKLLQNLLNNFVASYKHNGLQWGGRSRASQLLSMIRPERNGMERSGMETYRGRRTKIVPNKKCQSMRLSRKMLPEIYVVPALSMYECVLCVCVCVSLWPWYAAVCLRALEWNELRRSELATAMYIYVYEISWGTYSYIPAVYTGPAQGDCVAWPEHI